MAGAGATSSGTVASGTAGAGATGAGTPGSSVFNEPWFGQLMAGPQFFAYLIEIDTWLREYRVQVRL